MARFEAFGNQREAGVEEEWTFINFFPYTPVIRSQFRFVGLPGGCTDVLNAFAASRQTHCADTCLASEHLPRSFLSSKKEEFVLSYRRNDTAEAEKAMY